MQIVFNLFAMCRLAASVAGIIRILLASTTVLLIVGSLSRADEPSEESTADLIEKLASPNRAPVWPDGDKRSEPEYGVGFDHDAQKRIMQTRTRLLKQGVAAFPDLIANLYDNRYSYTDHPSVWVNSSVGMACYEIVNVQVSIYSEFMRREKEGRRLPSWFSKYQTSDDFRDGMRQWWAKHNGKSLRELQIDAVRWARAYEVRKGFGASKERARVIGGLDRLAERLKSSDKAIEVSIDGKFLGDDAALGQPAD